MVPYQRNAHFKGRAGLLAKLHDNLCEEVKGQWNHRVALYGLGGVGKTQLALEYVHSERGYYEWIFWISTVSEASLLSGLQDIGAATGCVDKTATLQPSELWRKVNGWFNNHKSWLLVLDNAEDAELVSNYLPQVALGKHTLITTRSRWSDEFRAEGLEVGILEVNDAKDLLLTRSRVGPVAETKEGQVEATKIVRELGCLPLAIEQAAAYIREALHDLFKFLFSYRENLKRHLERRPKANQTYYKDSVATTWHLSFQRIEETDPDASELLRFFAFLNPDGVMTEFLLAGKDGLDGELKEIISDSFRFTEALSVLEHFSLIGRVDDGESERITVHRLVQHVIQYEMPATKMSVMKDAVVKLCGTAFPDGVYADNERRLLCRKYQDQVLAPLLTMKNVNSKDVADLLRVAGEFLRDEGKFRQSVELLERSVKIYESYEKDGEDTLWALASLAWTQGDQGQYSKAIEIDEKILSVRRERFGEDDDTTLTAMNNLGVDYDVAGRYQQAVDLKEKVLEKRLKLWGPEHEDTVLSMGNLAILYQKLGRWNESAKLSEKVLEIQTRVWGAENIETLSSMADLAIVYCLSDRLFDALKLCENVLECRTKLLGPEHRRTLETVADINWVHRSFGRLEKAAQCDRALLELRTKLFGEDDLATVSSMICLVENYYLLGRTEEAIPLGIKALEATKRLLGDGDRDTLNIMQILARVYREAGKIDEAIALLEKAIEGETAALGLSEHIDVLRLKMDLAVAFQKQGKLDDATATLENIIETMKRTVGSDYSTTLKAIGYLGTMYREQGRINESVQLLGNVLETQKRTLPDDSFYIAETTKNLETSCRLQREGASQPPRQA